MTGTRTTNAGAAMSGTPATSAGTEMTNTTTMREDAEMTNTTTMREDAEMTNGMTAPAADAAGLERAGDYQSVMLFAVPPETVFAALTTTAGLTSWWMDATGSGMEGGELRFTWDSPDPLILHVDVARRPSAVEWTVLECKAIPDWTGTRPCFALAPHGTGGCELQFRHYGLTAELECFSFCKPGWDQALASLHAYAETGHARPSVTGDAAAADQG